MSAIVRRLEHHVATTAEPENSPSSASWVIGLGRTGGASATLVASCSNSGAHCVPDGR